MQREDEHNYVYLYWFSETVKNSFKPVFQLSYLPDGNFELLLGINQESGQFFIWLIKTNEQNLLHIWYL